MSGGFDSSAQAARDTSYRDQGWHVLPIFTQRTPAPSLHVEEAIATAPHEPASQQVYRLRVESHGLSSDVYMLQGDTQVSTAPWRDGVRFPGFTIALVSRCAKSRFRDARSRCF